VHLRTLRLDPSWDPIGSDARFQALLVKYGNPLAVGWPASDGQVR
jgi:hypothetical protein